MTISSVSSSPLSQQIAGYTSTNKSATADLTSLLQDSASGVSKLGGFMKQLEDLLESDPEKFKTVTSQVADKLRDAAAQASDSGDTAQASMLNDLASKFETASENGTMPDLRPPGGGPQGPPPGSPPMGPPPDATGSDGSDTTSDTTSSSSVAALFGQSTFTDPLSILTSIMDEMFA